MAHKIDHSKGQAAFISYQKPAWHGLGKVFNQDITIAQALNESGLDFEVLKAPNVHRIDVWNGEKTQGLDHTEKEMPDGSKQYLHRIETISENSFFTYRTDTNAVLGDKLGKQYTVYQNTDALAVVDEMLKLGKVKIETAGSVDAGRRVFVCLKLQNPIVVAGNDPVDQYVLLANGHDGSLAITAMPTNVRVVCWNTLSAALGAAKAEHKIRHTKNSADRVKEAFKIMGLLEDNSKHNTAAYNAMKHNTLFKSEFFDYIGNIFFDAEEIAALQKGDKDALSSRKKNVIAEVLEFAEVGVGQREALGDGQPNMWYAYNAVTGYLTGKKYKNADDRFDSLILGDSARKIAAAGDLALKPHTIRPLKATGAGLSSSSFN